MFVESRITVSRLPHVRIVDAVFHSEKSDRGGFEWAVDRDERVVVIWGVVWPASIAHVRTRDSADSKRQALSIAVCKVAVMCPSSQSLQERGVIGSRSIIQSDQQNEYQNVIA